MDGPQVLRVRPPGIEWKTGRNPKMGKNWPKNRKRPSARNGEKMAQKWRKNGIWGHFSIFSPFLGHFFPISGRGPFSIFWPIFSHFWIVFHSIPGGLTRNSSARCFLASCGTPSSWRSVRPPNPQLHNRDPPKPYFQIQAPSPSSRLQALMLDLASKPKFTT